MRFVDRRQAGKELAERLQGEVGGDVVVVALARGGVPVADVVAEALGAPLLALTPRKIGHPSQPEYALAAVCGDGPVVMGAGPAGAFDDAGWERAVASARQESRRRSERYGAVAPEIAVAERTVVLVDDGVATGLTLRAAIAAMRRAGASRVVVGVPVAPAATVARLRAEVDAVVAVWVPEPFPGAVGHAYARFEQVSDGEVLQTLGAAQRRWRALASSAMSSS